MSKNVQEDPKNLPAVVENAEQIARLATGLGASIGALFYPPLALAQPVLDLAITRYIKRPQRILLERLSAGGVTSLNENQLLQFAPMLTRLIEASRAGEYEHNLRLLSEFITSELKQPEPEAANFLRVARQVEGLSREELQVVAMVDVAFSDMDVVRRERGVEGEPPFVAAKDLSEKFGSTHGLSQQQIAEALNMLSARGLLLPEGASRFDKDEEYYLRTASFSELVDRARSLVREPLDEAKGA